MLLAVIPEATNINGVVGDGEAGFAIDGKAVSALRAILIDPVVLEPVNERVPLRVYNLV